MKNLTVSRENLKKIARYEIDCYSLVAIDSPIMLHEQFNIIGHYAIQLEDVEQAINNASKDNVTVDEFIEDWFIPIVTNQDSFGLDLPMLDINDIYIPSAKYQCVNAIFNYITERLEDLEGNDGTLFVEAFDVQDLLKTRNCLLRHDYPIYIIRDYLDKCSVSLPTVIDDDEDNFYHILEEALNKDIHAAYRVKGDLYYSGVGREEKNIELAKEYYKKAINNVFFPYCISKLAEIALINKSYLEAYEYLSYLKMRKGFDVINDDYRLAYLIDSGYLEFRDHNFACKLAIRSYVKGVNDYLNGYVEEDVRRFADAAYYTGMLHQEDVDEYSELGFSFLYAAYSVYKELNIEEGINKSIEALEKYEHLKYAEKSQYSINVKEKPYFLEQITNADNLVLTIKPTKNGAHFIFESEDLFLLNLPMFDIFKSTNKFDFYTDDLKIAHQEVYEIENDFKYEDGVMSFVSNHDKQMFEIHTVTYKRKKK